MHTDPSPTVPCDRCGADVPEHAARLSVLDDGAGGYAEVWECRACVLRAEVDGDE